MKRLRSPWLMGTTALLAWVLLWDAGGLDLRVMQFWGTTQGFPLKNHAWLSQILHDRGKQVAAGFYLLMWLLVWRPWGPWCDLRRRERLAAALAVTASVLSVSLLKHFSLTSCHWDLRLFGGSAEYVSHWAWGLADNGGGKCFPGGHAFSAFGFLALSLPFLMSQETRLRRHGWRWLIATVVVGLVFGAAQTVRGAHYPSQTFWTAWICWTVGLILYHVAAPRTPDRAA